MKEYNWNKEREKYRPDFQKEETSGVEEVKTQPVQKPFLLKLSIIVCIVLLVAVIAGSVFMIKSKDSSTQLAEVAERHKTAVGLVALTIEFQNGKNFTSPLGTAWAFCKNQFATNGHVANGIKETLQQIINTCVINLLENEAKKNGCKSVKELMEKLGTRANAVVESATKQVLANIKNVRADIIINGTQRKSYSVTHVQIHKDYGSVGTKYNPDIAVLTIDGQHDNFFKVANKNTLFDLKSGTPIAFLGFPMENLSNNNVNVDNPVASMQSGIVVAVSDFDMKDVGKTGNFLLRHNLPATGGASGSPIFNRNGDVIALLYAGNIIGQVDDGKVKRAPSAAMINFGVRVDLLEGMGEKVYIKKFLQL